MSNRTRRSSEERAEARRRARLAARGLESDDTGDGDETEQAAGTSGSPAGGSFLTRLFPPAPPLPGKRDPLAGFTYSGPLRGAVAGIYLLGTNPVPWLGLGAVWAVGRLLTAIFAASVIGLAASLVSFGALILAGWLGWQRPWLFGLLASIIGMGFFGGLLGALVGGTAQANGASIFEVVAGTLYLETIGFQPLFGVIAGWYGGYLRRRMAATSPAASTRRRSRR